MTPAYEIEYAVQDRYGIDDSYGSDGDSARRDAALRRKPGEDVTVLSRRVLRTDWEVDG